MIAQRVEIISPGEIMRFIVSILFFMTSVSAFALDVAGSPKSVPLNPKIEIKCTQNSNLKVYDHGVLEAQFSQLAIVNSNVEMTLSFQKHFCQKNSAGTIEFVSHDMFENYTYNYMQDILVEPLQFAVTAYNISTYEDYGGVALKAEQPINQFSVSIPLTKLLSASEMDAITNGGKKIEKTLGVSVNQLSNYTTMSDFKTIQANQFFHLKTSLIFF